MPKTYLERIWGQRLPWALISAFIAMGIYLVWQLRHTEYEAFASVIIPSAIRSEADGPPAPEILTKALTSHSKIERVAQEIAKEANQPKDKVISDERIKTIQKKIQIEGHREPGLFTIHFYDKEPHVALAAIRVIVGQLREIKTFPRADETIQKNITPQQLTEAPNKLAAIEKNIFERRKNGTPIGAKAALESRLLARQSERAKLLESMTEKHPQILKLDEEIVRIQKDLERVNLDEAELHQLSVEWQKEKAAYAQAREAAVAAVQVNPAPFSVAVSQEGLIRVLGVSSTVRRVIHPPPLAVITASFILSLAAGLLIILRYSQPN